MLGPTEPQSLRLRANRVIANAGSKVLNRRLRLLEQAQLAEETNMEPGSRRGTPLPRSRRAQFRVPGYKKGSSRD
jgi:hypothetical protein